MQNAVSVTISAPRRRMRFSSDFICNTSEYEFGTDVCGIASLYAWQRNRRKQKRGCGSRVFIFTWHAAAVVHSIRQHARAIIALFHKFA